MARTVRLEEYARTTSRRKSNFVRYGTVILFLLPFIAAFIVFFVYPLFFGIYISLTNFKFNSPTTPALNNFRWYEYLFSPSIVIRDRVRENLYFQTFWRSFLHTLIFAVLMVPVAIIVPLFLAILINSKPVGYKVFRCLIYLPSIVPLTAAGSIFILMFMKGGILGSGGALGVNLNFFGSGNDVTSWKINNDLYVACTWIVIYLMCFWGGWGGNFIILNAGLQNVPKALYEAASIDGCSKWKQTINITLAGIKPQLVLCLFTTIIGYLGLYGQNYVLNSGGPWYIKKFNETVGGGNTSTVIYFIQDIVTSIENRSTIYGLAAAASIVFAVVVGVISGLQMYFTRDRKTGYKISQEFKKWDQVA